MKKQKQKKPKKEAPEAELLHVGMFLKFDPSEPDCPIVIDDDEFHMSIEQAEQYRFELDQVIRRAYVLRYDLSQQKKKTA